jgi:hypothetical protein
MHLCELGEIAVNTPRNMLRPSIQGVLPFVGAAVLGLAIAGVVIMLRQRRPGPTEIFLCSYLFVIFLWPYYDPRFWLPVIPLFLAYIGLAAKPVMCYRFTRVPAQAYLILFASLGMAMLASSTLVTFSGSRFPDVYQDGVYKPTYCAVFRSCSGKSEAPVDSSALHLLLTYGVKAK